MLPPPDDPLYRASINKERRRDETVATAVERLEQVMSAGRILPPDEDSLNMGLC